MRSWLALKGLESPTEVRIFHASSWTVRELLFDAASLCALQSIRRYKTSPAHRAISIFPAVRKGPEGYASESQTNSCLPRIVQVRAALSEGPKAKSRSSLLHAGVVAPLPQVISGALLYCEALAPYNPLVS